MLFCQGRPDHDGSRIKKRRIARLLTEETLDVNEIEAISRPPADEKLDCPKKGQSSFFIKFCRIRL
jgi:hypothetical protein